MSPEVSNLGYNTPLPDITLNVHNYTILRCKKHLTLLIINNFFIVIW